MKTNLTRKDAQTRAELISNVRYDIAVDITGAEEFTTVSTVTFDSKAGTTHFDLVAREFEATLDGNKTGRELSLDDDTHTLKVTSTEPYNRTGEGLHKFTDPVDGKDYLYTQFEPAMAMKVFAGFDQPDLKATYKVSVKAPERYTVILNEAVERTDNGDGTSTWTTVIDYPLSTYLIAICAGEFERVSDTYDAGDGRVIELGLYARASLIPHMDSERLFRQTKEGFDFYHANFGRTYPFGDKYDQVFCPEYNMGAMEHVGCVTYRDEYVFTSEPTPYRLERRNDTILHEMAHMWFGDLVTMQWWDDLWLNESFATWSAATAQTAIGEYADAWTTFASVEKAWAYQQDQLPSTHPIAADAPDIETAEQNFDGITYAKGASVLKQLQAYVGYEEFFAGVRTHFDNHAYSNATFADLLGALEGGGDAGGVDTRGEFGLQAGHDGDVEHARALVERVVHGLRERLQVPGVRVLAAGVRGGLPDGDDLRLGRDAERASGNDAGDRGAVVVAVLQGVVGHEVPARAQVRDVRVRRHPGVDDGDAHAFARGKAAQAREVRVRRRCLHARGHRARDLLGVGG